MKVLKLVMTKDVMNDPQLMVITEDGIIYRVKVEKYDALTDESLHELNEELSREK